MRYAMMSIAVVLSACGPETDPEATRAEGARLFAENCTACHGLDATGNGPAAAAFERRPPDLTRIAARRDGTWPILEVMSILDGYTRAFTPDAQMPVIAELRAGPAVSFDPGNGIEVDVPARLLAMASYLESIQSPPPERYVP